MVNEEELRGYLQELDSCKHMLSAKCTDIVAAYIYLNRFDSAYFWSQKLVAKFPEEYNAVINHAVVLELLGRPEEALVFLNKAIRLNPMSHNGSEWIHRVILENVIAGNTQPHTSILGWDFGNDSLPLLPGSMQVYRSVRELEYQVTDRIYFVKDKDPLFASLLFDYANVRFLNDNLHTALIYMELAEKYGYMGPNLNKRKTKFNQLVELQKQPNRWFNL